MRKVSVQVDLFLCVDFILLSPDIVMIPNLTLTERFNLLSFKCSVLYMGNIFSRHEAWTPRMHARGSGLTQNNTNIKIDIINKYKFEKQQISPHQ